MQRARETADELLHFVGLQAQADLAASALTYGQQRLLEVARALAAGPRLLLLDEPAAGLNAIETDLLAQTIGRIIERGIVPRALVDGVAKDLQGELTKPMSPIRDESGVLLAYLGYQFGEKQWITDGLSVADKLVDPANGPLYTLLGEVWTKPPTEPAGAPLPAAAPAPAPAPAAAPATPDMNK